ncbi:MAG: 16S rRNA (cytidine(1402)-2'-O)-methyltransferase [Deltaproteobacteria bacterium]|nr:16S rRNA (cytidine(1402)-2'-O)-methyltransferase [Deltaproteobacteria bacterium]
MTRQARGSLHVVATPIGNLGDLSPRAVQTLAQADVVLCEDTRHTAQLMNHLGLHKPMESLHAHNEHARAPDLVAQLRAGAKLALVSDAGTPCLSDPGAHLVQAAHAAGVAVLSIPGPFAVATALAGSGLCPIPFAFWGFVAKKAGERRRDLHRQLQPGPDGPMTHAYYVPGRDLTDVLADIAAVAPGAQVCVARELTKVHEQFLVGTALEVVSRLVAEQLRGEAVVLVEVAAGAARNVDAGHDVVALVAAARAAGEPRKGALQRLAALTGRSRNDLYDLWLAAGPGAEEEP